MVTVDHISSKILLLGQDRDSLLIYFLEISIFKTYLSFVQDEHTSFINTNQPMNDGRKRIHFPIDPAADGDKTRFKMLY